MASRFNNITFDCTDAHALAGFWSQVLGATRIADHRTADGAGWVVLADPEGNEFCVERGDAGRGPAEPKRYRIGAD